MHPELILSRAGRAPGYTFPCDVGLPTHGALESLPHGALLWDVPLPRKQSLNRIRVGCSKGGTGWHPFSEINLPSFKLENLVIHFVPIFISENYFSARDRKHQADSSTLSFPEFMHRFLYFTKSKYVGKPLRPCSFFVVLWFLIILINESSDYSSHV